MVFCFFFKSFCFGGVVWAVVINVTAKFAACVRDMLLSVLETHSFPGSRLFWVRVSSRSVPQCQFPGRNHLTNRKADSKVRLCRQPPAFLLPLGCLSQGPGGGVWSAGCGRGRPPSGSGHGAGGRSCFFDYGRGWTSSCGLPSLSCSCWGVSRCFSFFLLIVAPL